MSFDLIGAPAFRMRMVAAPVNLRRSLRAGFTLAGADITNAMRASAGSWSTTIPGAIETQTKFGIKSAGVIIRVNGSKAPHAHLYELTKHRHPLFGDTEYWYTYPKPGQADRQFFYKSAHGKMAAARHMAQRALMTAFP